MPPTTVDPAEQILSDTQFEVLQKLRESGTKGFIRNDYKVLQGVRRRCRDTLKHFDAAKKIYIEIDELMRGGGVIRIVTRLCNATYVRWACLASSTPGNHVVAKTAKRRLSG